MSGQLGEGQLSDTSIVSVMCACHGRPDMPEMGLHMYSDQPQVSPLQEEGHLHHALGVVGQ